MKKTLTALAVFAGIALGDQDLTIDGTTTGNFDSLNGNGNTVCDISVTETATVARIDGSSINNLTTITLMVADNATFTVTGNAKLPFNNTNKTYSTMVTLGENSQFNVNGILYFGSRNSTYTGIVQNTSITFGSGASMTVGTLETVAAGGGTSSLTLTAYFDADAIDYLTNEENFYSDVTYTRTLVTATNGFSNYTADSFSLTGIADLDTLGYANVGVVTSMDSLKDGDYGLLYTNNQLSLVAKTIPEPATAALSLLALAGLTVRRRRS